MTPRRPSYRVRILYSDTLARCFEARYFATFQGAADYTNDVIRDSANITAYVDVRPDNAPKSWTNTHIATANGRRVAWKRMEEA